MTFLQQADHLVRNHPANKELMEKPDHLSLPVRWDGYSYYWGEDMTMVADIDTVYEGEGFRLRGWGHLQDETKYQENAKYIEEAINSHKQPHLEHYLRVFGNKLITFIARQDVGLAELSVNYEETETIVRFNLTTGTPATEKDAEEFIKLVS